MPAGKQAIPQQSDIHSRCTQLLALRAAEQLLARMEQQNNPENSAMLPCKQQHPRLDATHVSAAGHHTMWIVRVPPHRHCHKWASLQPSTICRLSAARSTEFWIA